MFIRNKYLCILFLTYNTFVAYLQLFKKLQLYYILYLLTFSFYETDTDT